MLSTANSFIIVFKSAFISNDIYTLSLSIHYIINIYIINIVDISPGNVIPWQSRKLEYVEHKSFQVYRSSVSHFQLGSLCSPAHTLASKSALALLNLFCV